MFKRLLIELVIFIGLMAMFTFTAFTAGYTAEKYYLSDRCINSACDVPCSEVKRFKRHQGECVP